MGGRCDPARIGSGGAFHAPLSDWADQGFYHVYAAALGSTPTDVQFEVTHAPTHVVTKTAKPKPTATTSPSGKASPNGKPTSSPTVKGKQSKCGGDNAASSC